MLNKYAEIFSEDPIVMKNATLSWIPKIVTLKNINFTVKPGELVAVVGTIGMSLAKLAIKQNGLPLLLVYQCL